MRVYKKRRNLKYTCVVYEGMFEQTLLTQPPPAQKTGALTISFLAQSCLLGVLIIGPLVYTQAMPLVAPPIELPVFIKPLAPEPPPEIAPVRAAPSSGRIAPRVFRPQPIYVTRVPTTPVEELIFDDIPEINSENVPRGTLGMETIGAPSLPGYIAEIPRAEIVKPLVNIPAEPVKPIAVSSGVLASKLLTRVFPQYPALAKSMRVSGVVRLAVVVGRDGHIEGVRVLEGHPMLRASAVDAVKQWVYSPTYLNGQPVEVEASVDVNFTLN